VAVFQWKYASLEPLRRVAVYVIAICGTIILIVAIRNRGFYGHNRDVLIYGLFPLGLLFSSILVLAISTEKNNLLRVFLRNAWLRTLGKISYGIYVFHWPIILILKRYYFVSNRNYWADQFLFLIMVVVFSVSTAWLSYQFFESPILKLKQRFTYFSRYQVN